MRFFILAAIFVVLFAGFAAAQPSGPPVREWSWFSPDDEEFEAEVPAPLTASRFKADPENQVLSRRYLNSVDDTYFYMFSDNPKTPEQFDFVSRVADVFNAKRTKVKIGELDGNRWSFQEADFFHEIVTVTRKRRIYVFQTISRRSQDPASERFLGSIRLVVRNPIVRPADQIWVEVPTKVENDIVPPVPDKALQHARVHVSFDDRKRVAGDPKKGPKKKPAFEASLERTPVPEYTSFAQFYEITGSVELLVVFNRDGSIGEITPVATLPGLLTFSATEAAKKIEFKPKKKSDNPEPVKRIATYRFFFY